MQGGAGLHSWLIPISLVFSLGLPVAARCEERPIDTQRSTLAIHVGKTGLLSSAGHEHWVDAPIEQGSVNDSGAAPSVNLAVQAARMTVRADKKLSREETAEVQDNMQSKVLASGEYPEILFRSTAILSKGDSTWSVSGNLTLHGVTKPVVFAVQHAQEAYTGSAKIKQTDFGIRPIQIAGGVVKVKDELEIAFTIYVKSAS